jgi:hypothetical protein
MEPAKKSLNTRIEPCMLPAGSQRNQVLLMLDPSIFIPSQWLIDHKGIQAANV